VSFVGRPEVSATTVTATTALYIDSTLYDENFNEQIGYWNGSFLETFNALVTSDGSTATMTLDNASLQEPELTMNFSDGYSKIASGSTVALTAGSDTSPTSNYIYIPQSTKVLTKSTTAFPTTEEHIKVGYFLVPSATYVRADGCYVNQNWNDDASDTNNQGGRSHMNERSRRLAARYFSGVGPNGTDDSAASSYFDYVSGTEAYFKSTAGIVYQMHQHTYGAKDSRTDDVLVVNDNTAAYTVVNDLTDITADSTGTSLTNRYFNLVFWGVANKTGEYTAVMCNLPDGSYANQTSAENDMQGYDVFTMPREFNLESSTGFLIARLTMRNNAGNWTHISTVDLRGSTPSVATGGAVGAIVDFPDNQFTVFDETDITKILAFDVGTLVGTGQTRTIQIPNVSQIMVTDNNLCTDLEGTGLSITAGVLNATGGAGTPGFVGWSQDSDDSAFTLSPVTGNTVSATTVTGTTVTGTTVFASQLFVGGGDIRGRVPQWKDIQFTIEQPDQIDTSDMMAIWENASGLDFNITEVRGRADTPYNFVIGMTDSKGYDNGIVVTFHTVTSSTVSWSTITDSTVLYFDASDQAPNHCKVTLKGYYR
jgi:hypothetical protein